MAKVSKKPLAILRITQYKGFTVMVQHLIDIHLFQFIASKDDNFYQGYSIIIPSKGANKKLTQEDIVKAGVVTLDMAYATCEAILAKDNPDKINKENALGADVVNALENANKPVQKVVN